MKSKIEQAKLIRKAHVGHLMMSMDIYAQDMFDNKNYCELGPINQAEVLERMLEEELITLK